MIARTRRPFVRFIVWLSILCLLVPVHTTRAQTPPTQPAPPAGQGSGQGSGTEAPAIDLANPPWNQSRERIPKEVKDKEKETPVAGCPPTRERNQDEEKVTYEVTYYDTNTQTTTRIRHTDIFESSRLSDFRRVWEITIEEPGKPKKKITYELKSHPADDEKRTEKWGKAPPDTRNVAPGDLFVPASPQTPAPTPGGQRGSWLYPFSSTRLASVAHRPGLFTATGDSLPTPSLPFLLAADATQERPSAQPPQETQERPRYNIKIVAIGGPPSEPVVVMYEPEPQTTPEEFVENPPGSTWDPTTDAQGPRTATPGPTGTPITGMPTGWINIGSGWTPTQRVPSQTFISCAAGGDEANELLSEAHRLKQLAEKAKQGGPNFWESKAKAFDSAALRAENDHRPQVVERQRKLAEETRAIANELKNKGIPDKPDPKLPKQQLDKLEKERQAAIQMILDEAAELTRRASIM